MNWKNLQKNKCPQCNGSFVKKLHTRESASGLILICSCGFEISEWKYKKIVSERVVREIEQRDEWDILQANSIKRREHATDPA